MVLDMMGSDVITRIYSTGCHGIGRDRVHHTVNSAAPGTSPFNPLKRLAAVARAIGIDTAGVYPSPVVAGRWNFFFL